MTQIAINNKQAIWLDILNEICAADWSMTILNT